MGENYTRKQKQAQILPSGIRSDRPQTKTAHNITHARSKRKTFHWKAMHEHKTGPGAVRQECRDMRNGQQMVQIMLWSATRTAPTIPDPRLETRTILKRYKHYSQIKQKATEQTSWQGHPTSCTRCPFLHKHPHASGTQRVLNAPCTCMREGRPLLSAAMNRAGFTCMSTSLVLIPKSCMHPPRSAMHARVKKCHAWVHKSSGASHACMRVS